MKTIALFGGSFDPPHVGHVLAVRYLLVTGAVDEVLIVPVYEHAFHKQLTQFEVRLELLRLAFADETRVTVSSVEQSLPRPNYTLNTVKALADQFPQAQFRLVVGADVLPDLDKWHHFEELRSLAPLLVLGRSGVTHADSPQSFLPEVSSTEVRELLRRLGNASDKERAPEHEALAQLVPKRVLDAIAAHGWYR